MTQSYDLTQMDAHSFEHLVNFLSLGVLGNGVTGFAAGPDGGRDGYLVGRAPYPTEVECWEGTWFIQSKFHKPHLSKDAQKWLIAQVKNEIHSFELKERSRKPDIWIIATNIEPSGSDQTGAYDQIKELVEDFDSNIKFDIWGGKKIIDFISKDPSAAKSYGHFLTPGHIISQLYDNLKKEKLKCQSIINHLLVHQFLELSYTKLEQAGSSTDHKPKIYELFIDLPISQSEDDEYMYFIMDSLVSASSNNQKISTWNKFEDKWRGWSKKPSRARVLLLKGGPGQGKSTAGQYFAQIQRAAFILSDNGPKVTPQIRDIARELKKEAEKRGFWPVYPRIPLFVELKDYANWYINKSEHDDKNIAEYICCKINNKLSKSIDANMLYEAFSMSTWFVNFDGLDEVPNDIKDKIANEITSFTNELIPELDADFLILCTTRPQGYSGQFETLDAATVTLMPLTQEIALECASALVSYNRDEEAAAQSVSILKSALNSDQVREIMTTPLQSHIMAVVVRDGGRPPEKRWELFNNFYTVMKKREGLKNFPDHKISILLRDQDQLLKAIHDRLGVSLHSKAEISSGAEAALERNEFRELTQQTAIMHLDGNTDDVVNTLMEATTERLVFVNTPESSNSVRFDIRQLQEFFAAEFIYHAVESSELQRRMELICGDAHWREVVHFVLSALSHHKNISDLSVVVDILQQLDDDSHNYKVKNFKKRMASGALLSLRLIEEGVLEQDKRIRQQFSKTLTPIWGLLELRTLNQITTIKKEQTRAWLLNSMIDAFLELEFSENIAIGIMLPTMLPDGHSRTDEVIQRIKSAPSFYIKAIYNSHSETTPMVRKKEYSLWFLNLTCKKIFADRDNLSSEFRDALNFLRTNKESIEKKIESLDLSKDERFLVSALVNKTSSEASFKEKQNDDNPYCFIQLLPSEYNWYINPNNDLITPYDFDDEFSNQPIIYLKKAIEFYLDNGVETFRSLVSSAQDKDFIPSIIPDYLKAMIPIDFDAKSLKYDLELLSKLDDESIHEIILTKGSGMPSQLNHVESFLIDDSPFDAQKWQKLCEDYPDMALRLWFGPFSSKRDMDKLIEKESQHFYPPILKIALERPDLFSGHFFKWTALFKIYPEHESQIRKSFSIYDGKVQAFRQHLENDDFSFSIDIENEKGIIFILAQSLFNTSLNIHSSRTVHVNSTRTDYDESFFTQFGLSNELLIEKTLNIDEPAKFRAACLSCIMAQTYSNKKEVLDDFFSKKIDAAFFEIINDDTIELLSRAISVFLYDVKNYEEKTIEFLGHFSSLTKDNFEVRLVTQSIYQRWRERSFAPVTNQDSLEDWLSYTY